MRRYLRGQTPTLTLLLCFIAFLTLAPVFAQVVNAQDDLDIPGLDETLQPTQAPATDYNVQMSEDQITLWGLLKSGGWCMWPLGLFSVAIVGLCIYNIMELRPSKFCPPELVAYLRERMHFAQVQDAYDAARENDAYMGQMFAHGLSFVDLQDRETLGREKVLESMQDFSSRANRKYMLWINYFSILAQASPMLGLLGTVSGMIKAFSTMGRGGMGDPSLLASNISEALVTTATGLTIAIPALFCFFVFRNRLAQLVGLCHDTAEDLVMELVAAVDPNAASAGTAAPQA